LEAWERERRRMRIVKRAGGWRRRVKVKGRAGARRRPE
jgi:hypothetical protein